MLSRLGRFIRGRFGRNRRRETEDEGIAEQRTATEAPPEAGDAFAQEVLRRVRPQAVSRVPRRSSLAVSGRRPLIQAATPRVRHDVPSTELPLARSAQPSAPPEEVEAGEALGGDTQFYEGTTGDARWDALWAMRGTPRTAGEAVPPDREGVPPPTPRERPAPRRSAPAGRVPSVQRAPSLPVQSTGTAGEGVAPSGEPPVQRTPEETEQEDVAYDATGEGIAPSRPLPPSQDEPRAPSPEPLRRTGEGVRPVTRAADAPLSSPGQERTPAEGMPAPEPPRVGRRIVPRSALEELPIRRETPPSAPRSETAPTPGPRTSAGREPASTAEPGPPSPDAAPPPAGTPVQRARAATEGVDTLSAEGVPSAEEWQSEALPADRAPPAARQVAPDQPRTETGPTGPQTPPPVQRTLAQEADRPVEGTPVTGQVPPTQPTAGESEPGAVQATPELPALERAEDELPAAERPPAAPQAAEPALDRRRAVERPPVEPRPLGTPAPAQSEERRATAPERPRASAGETDRDRPPSALPATARGAPGEAAHPTSVVGRRVQPQPPVPAADAAPVEGPAIQKPVPGKPEVQQHTAQEPAAPEPTIQRSVAEEPVPEKPGAEPGLPEVEGPARDLPAPSRAGARPTEYTAEAPEVSAAAARIQRDADTDSTGEGEPDRRMLLRQAMQPRIVPTVVQAAPADGTPTAGTTEAAPQAAAAGAPEGAEGPDVESLARDVYRILRRRLLVERERDLGAG